MSTAAPTTLPPALLADATWYGTLAAARDLGRHGVPVTLATDRAVAPARWSRYVHRTVRCPPTKDAPAFLAWLLEFGRREPGHVLYPTSDELAWMVATNAAELGRWFSLYTPPDATLLRLLDKANLAAEGRAAGLDVPDTWCPTDEEEVARVGREATFPLFLKPRTQLLAQAGGKGVRVGRSEELLPAWRRLREGARYDAVVRARMPGVELPMIQACSGTERIYTVDGFVDGTGELFATLGCVKLLQRPRGLGPGIAFESSPVAPAVAEGLRRLLVATGFRGVFDAEFLESGNRLLLIDLNPRYYNHMAFEVDRGLHLPWMAYLGACGETAALAAEVARAWACAADGASRAYVHHLSARLVLSSQALVRAMPREERLRWRRWIAGLGATATDPARAPGDVLPGVFEVALELAAFGRHPRSYLRGLAAAPRR